MNLYTITIYIFSLFMAVACGKEELPMEEKEKIKILTLGDSYTYGESVCEACDFPSLLVDSLEKRLDRNDITLLSIAQTGWTTTNLISAINTEMPATDYDIVTLLIGVNNQYQNKSFSVMESEFPELVNRAIDHAGGNKEHVVILSIPDYAFTPFGQNFNPDKISEELDKYNVYIEEYAEQVGITFFNITDITREGLDKPELVASDGLHPSGVAYKRFVDRMFSYVYQQVTE